MTPRVKNVLGMGRPTTSLMGAGQSGPEHILLGLVHDGDGVGAEVLIRCGIDLDEVERRLHGLIAG